MPRARSHPEQCPTDAATREPPSTQRVNSYRSSAILNDGVGVVFDLAVSPDGTRLLYRYGDPFKAHGGIGVVFVGTGPPKFAAAVTSASWLGQPGGPHAAWLDNETLIVTEVTPV